MLRAIMIDDEQPNHILLKRAIEQNGHLEVVGQYTHPQLALEQIQVRKPDVAFVDIEMPDMNGLELAERILALDAHIQIIFVTAYSQYALEAFKVNALDYILKPIDPQEMSRVIHKILHYRSLQRREPAAAVQENRPTGKILCLGEFEVYGQHSVQKVQWMTAKVEELFAYLVIHAGKPVDKWKLCDLLWPSLDPEKASTNLHTSVYRLKKTIASEEVPIQIKSGKNSYWLELGDCLLDVQELERRYSELDKSSQERSREEEMAMLIEAEQYFRGELFENKAYLWSTAHGEAINQMYIRLVYRLLDAYRQAHTLEKGLEPLKRLLRFFPYEERACILLMDLYDMQKDKPALMRQYQQYRQSLMEELGIRPSQTIHTHYEKLIQKL